MTRFARHLQDYLLLRRSLGYKLEDHARLLRHFCAHLDDIGAEFVTVELTLSWALELKMPPGSTVPATRLLVVRGFARYMSGIDRRTEIPPAGLIPLRRHRRPPFIYTDAEVLALMAQARTGIRQALCAATYETLIGLLAATGMRISEAINLDRTDVDWTDGVLLVRDSKFNKSRSCRCTRRPFRRSRTTPVSATSCAPIRATRVSSCHCAERGFTPARSRRPSDASARTPASDVTRDFRPGCTTSGTRWP